MNIDKTVYYLGPEGSYSYLLLKALSVKESQMIPLMSFQDIITKVEQDSQAIGLLAIENSISSSVHQTVDLLYAQSVSIIGEGSMLIEMSVLTAEQSSLDDITDIYSHPQALAQCSHYIKEKGWHVHEMKSTAAAAEFVKLQHDKTKAAIGTRWIAQKNNLFVCIPDISNARHNMTRWVFVATPGAVSLGEKIDKLTYIFKVKHETGSLVSVLKTIADLQGNLTKIESRPLPGTHWEYGFWIDIEIPEGTHEQFDTMMKSHTLESRLIGAYQRGTLIPLQTLINL